MTVVPALHLAKGAVPHKLTHAGIKYSKVEVLDLKRVFDDHDTDKDGKVTPLELHKTLGSNKHFSLQGREAFRTIDLNADGLLSFDEYLHTCFPFATVGEHKIMMAWAHPAKVALPPVVYVLSAEQLNDMHIMFNMYDKDKSGKIERAELVAASLTCGYDTSEVDLLFSNMDKDKDSLISFEEFADLMSNSFIGEPITPRR